VAATDDYGVDHYVVSVGGSPVATVDASQTSYPVTRLRPGTTYQFALSAVDGSGNSTAYPGAVSATTNPPYDTGVPDWPRGARLSASGVGPTSVTLRWPAATDDQQVAGYRVYVNGQPITNGQAFTPIDTAATTSELTWTVTGLAPGTRYTFTVQAGDTAGKWTGSGPSVVVTTKRS
jgi:exo-poly-alpha-galacturonosidase